MIDSNLTPPASRKFEFPLLAKSGSTDLVVLFTNPTTGTVVVANSIYGVGQFCKSWNPVDADWEPLPPGSRVTLEQK